uniref:2Fe-2S ferredoxin-type domain-containing protein n=2 Tax=Asteraceae TaxID=4210 RepID=A0A9R1VPB9_LACSA|nr:hypothetical protein LSAT_V11C400193530 [Lactuca sativa]
MKVKGKYTGLYCYNRKVGLGRRAFIKSHEKLKSKTNHLSQLWSSEAFTSLLASPDNPKGCSIQLLIRNVFHFFFRSCGSSTIMFISKISRLGAQAFKGLSKGLIFDLSGCSPLRIPSRRSFFPKVQNDYLFSSSHKSFSTTPTGNSQGENEDNNQKISVTFFDKDGEEQEIKVPIGMSMLEAAHENDIELEGACEGSLACSTCHVIVMDVEQYNKLEDPTDEENDMLDLAFGLTETSRLGCQVIAKPELDGLRLALPAATRNFAVDGYKPKPH